MANTLLRFAVKRNIAITQNILEKGHTQMEVDSVHSTIERCLRRQPIYAPCNYVEMIQRARQVPYKVKYIDHSFFRDYSALRFYETIRPSNKVGDPVITDIRSLKYTKDGKIMYKLSHLDDYMDLPVRRNTTTPTGHELVTRLYTKQLKIKESKYQHLQELKEVIPKDYHLFYDVLSH